MTSTKAILENSKEAKRLLRGVKPSSLDLALSFMCEEIDKAREEILLANKRDCEAAKDTVSSVMIDRLRLTDERINGIIKGIEEVRALPCPIGELLEKRERPNGLVIEKKATPIGTLAIIYESRPNVTADCASLSIKSGNVCILRSGKEAHKTAERITEAIRRALKRAELPEDTIQLIEDTTRQSSLELMKADGYVDMLIPRGSHSLIRACVENSTVPVLETGTGICHLYVDKSADLDMALKVIENAKTSRPSVCNALEVCLVDRAIAGEFLPKLKARLTEDRAKAGLTPVELRLDGEAIKIIDGTPMSESDFDTEFLDFILAVGIVDGVKDAVLHIGRHSTGHSEAIIATDTEAQEYFTEQVDSAAVYVNASTRFTDGGEFGLGCEMGISTQKLHARGPVGIRELMSYKYVVTGNGQIR